MKINVIVVGKIREDYINSGICEFLKRLTPYANFEITEIPAYLIKSQQDELKARHIEAQKILSCLAPTDYTIALDVKGKQLSSEELASKIGALSNEGISKINFIIGSSTGLDESVLNTSDFRLSFSKLTFTHQMIRLILLEQIYRAFKILNNEPYHK